MSGKVIGYVRVSSIDQNTARQLESIKLDKVFTDQVSGSSTNRPALNNLLDYVREDDMVIIHSMDRLARNLEDLRKIVKQLTSQNITVRFIKENLSFNSEETAISNLMLSIMGAFAEFERSLIKERQMEGIALAKKKGVYRGRKSKFSANLLQEIKLRLSKGLGKSAIARELHLSRESIYQYLKRDTLSLR